MPAKKSRTPSGLVRQSGALNQAAGIVDELVDASQRVAGLVSIRRPDDLMVADLWLTNLKVVTGASPTLARRDSKRQASIVLQLPPQSFGEEALLDETIPEIDEEAAKEYTDSDTKNAFKETAETASPLGTTKIRMAGPSRLAFSMPRDVTSIPFTLEAILEACRTWPLRRSLTARPASIDAAMANGAAGTNRAAVNADIAFLRSAVTSDEFLGMRESVAVTLDGLGVAGAAEAIAKAGDALVPVIRQAMTGRDDVAGERVVAQRMGTAIDAIVARFPVLGRDAGTRALVEAGIGYQASTGIVSAADTANAFDITRRVPLVPALFAPYRPLRDQTAIEMPYRLVISPVGDTRWNHRTQAVARQGRHELWHTRLGSAGALGATEGQTDARAIWSDDYGREDLEAVVNEMRPFRMPLDPLDRELLVRLTAGFRERRNGDLPYTPQPFVSRRLILSALGGHLDAEGVWTLRPQGVDLEQWQHRLSLGRDHYVRVVYAGYLMPFGHAASLIKVTERKFEGASTSRPLEQRVARLRQRYFIVVREPVKRFNGSRHVNQGHAFPFTSVELLTRVTPKLLPPDDPSCRVSEAGGFLYATSQGVTEGLTFREAFWPMTREGGENFRFNIAATDRDGRRTSFALPLMFVAERANTGVGKKGTTSAEFVDHLRAGYNKEGDLRRRAHLGGDSICYAPPEDDALGDPRLPTETMKFKAGDVVSNITTQLNAYPEVETAYVALRPVQRILGRDDAKVHVQYDPIYAVEGFGPNNTGELFLKFADINPSWEVNFGPSADASRTDAVGAVASPSMKIMGVSRLIGMASDPDEVQRGSFRPATFFKDARILGGIKLAEIIAGVDTGLRGAEVPKFVTRELPAGGGLPARTEARYDWTTAMESPDAKDILIPQADKSKASAFIMSAVTTARVGQPNSASTVISATMTNFSVNMWGFVILRFNSLRFDATDGRKPDVTVAMHPTDAVMFGGPLNFVNKLREFIPSDGFSDPSAIAVTPSGISAGYSLTVPHAEVGVFALSGLSIGAHFELPFDAQPMSAAFSFGKREDPFSLTISLLGGGGFLIIGIGADGVREIEAAVEAQARLSIDLGVASGSVEISLSIYFHWLTAASGDGAVELSGYVRLHGELNVMCIVSLSLTFNLQLGIEKRGGSLLVFGEASLTVEIEVLVFSGEVTVRCRREFKNPEADPTFAQLITGLSTWESYAQAFAAE